MDVYGVFTKTRFFFLAVRLGSRRQWVELKTRRNGGFNSKYYVRSSKRVHTRQKRREEKTACI